MAGLQPLANRNYDGDLMCPSVKFHRPDFAVLAGFGGVSWSEGPGADGDSTRQSGPGMVPEEGVVPFRIV